MTRRRLALVAAIVGLLLVAAGVWINVNHRPPTTPPTALQPSPLISPIFASPPGPTRPGYHVKSAELGIDLPIVEGDGWTVPYDKAAHYPGMKWPGDNGRSMIYAHALSGMFGPLFHASVGQHVDVERAGKPTLHYVIRQYFPHWSPSDLTYTRPLGREELVLLTCTTYNANDPRILVVAEPL
jgi:LPXTG-site transpeptidase (sortase) family protein